MHQMPQRDGGAFRILPAAMQAQTRRDGSAPRRSGGGPTGSSFAAGCEGGFPREREGAKAGVPQENSGEEAPREAAVGVVLETIQIGFASLPLANVFRSGRSFQIWHTGIWVVLARLPYSFPSLGRRRTRRTRGRQGRRRPRRPAGGSPRRRTRGSARCRRATRTAPLPRSTRRTVCLSEFSFGGWAPSLKRTGRRALWRKSPSRHRELVH